MAATFKFVSSDHTAPKRLQSSKACENCRRRKRRCIHGDNALNPSTSPKRHDTSTSVNRHRSTESQSSGPGGPERVDKEVVDEVPQLHGGDRLVHDQDQHREDDLSAARNSRFIGDLNPESIFLAATSSSTSRGVSLDDSVGIWSNTSFRSQGPQSSSFAQSATSLFYRSSSIVQKVFVPMLEQECHSTVPPPESVKALASIYFDKIYPILPLVRESTLHSDLSTPDRIILQQGICLAASKDRTARDHLTLSDAAPLSCREFGEKLSAAMRLSIELGLVTNKVVLIQALALLSQFTDDPPGEDLSSQFCIRAVHQVQSLGLHIKGREEDTDQGNTILLCCIWALDRMNAAFKGRPVTMHERDLRKDLGYCFEQQDPSFRLLLEVVALLDKVIELYRPLANPGDAPMLDMEFPSFEEIVLKCGGSNIGMMSLASIEVLYHGVAILSCRTRSWVDPERSSTAFLRQSLSTSTLTLIFSKTPQDQLVLFPFVPYAMSLSMSIVYREMRYSKVPTHRARARSQFHALCDSLSALGETFWSASTTADMGKKLLKEMDRVFSTVAAFEDMATNRTSAAAPGVRYSAPGNANANAGPSNPEADQLNVSMQDFDISILGSATDIDLFGLFDPAFDLDGFDAYLESNINPGFPSGIQ
ncbi:hypothetical protein VTL71DRAFT_4090 [Oculimacula yallundae]|uniref:Xylanolytic transcriptional activator regulatory domain-containing protein n=1 Tax=Oculimacula yallundae TaxID=86028 RepID=A0ABR4C4T5_9HELO